MPGVSRDGDCVSGHGCYGGHNICSGSPNVFVNNIACARVSDCISEHCCGTSCHSSSVASGWPTVFVNNLNIAYIGSECACGGNVACGSNNVFVGES